jgi:hypothetical protein
MAGCRLYQAERCKSYGSRKLYIQIRKPGPNCLNNFEPASGSESRQKAEEKSKRVTRYFSSLAKQRAAAPSICRRLDARAQHYFDLDLPKSKKTRKLRKTDSASHPIFAKRIAHLFLQLYTCDKSITHGVDNVRTSVKSLESRRRGG